MNIRPKMLRIFAAVVLLIVGVMIYMASTGQLVSISQNVLGAVTSPFRKFTRSISRNMDAWTDRTFNIDAIMQENEELKKEVNDLRVRQIFYDKMKLENEEYKKLLGVLDSEKEYDLVPANVIGRDGLDKFYSFTIDEGTESGIRQNDVVICADGLVGVVVDTGPGFAKVSTILSPAVNVGAFIGEGREITVVNGNIDMSRDRKCVAQYLSTETQVKEGDLVSTSGYGTVFPQGVIIGTVDSVFFDKSGTFKSALVTPSADIRDVRVVFVVKGDAD